MCYWFDLFDQIHPSNLNHRANSLFMHPNDLVMDWSYCAIPGTLWLIYLSEQPSLLPCSVPLPHFPFTFSLSLVFLSEFSPSFLCLKFHLKSHYCPNLPVDIRLWMFNTEWQWTSASSTNCTNHYFKNTTWADCVGLTQKKWLMYSTHLGWIFVSVGCSTPSLKSFHLIQNTAAKSQDITFLSH